MPWRVRGRWTQAVEATLRVVELPDPAKKALVDRSRAFARAPPGPQTASKMIAGAGGSSPALTPSRMTRASARKGAEAISGADQVAQKPSPGIAMQNQHAADSKAAASGRGGLQGKARGGQSASRGQRAASAGASGANAAMQIDERAFSELAAGTVGPAAAPACEGRKRKAPEPAEVESSSLPLPARCAIRR